MTPPQEKSNQEICRMTIMFPIDTDEQAIQYKKEIMAVLADRPDAGIDFRITTMPKGLNRAVADST